MESTDELESSNLFEQGDEETDGEAVSDDAAAESTWTASHRRLVYWAFLFVGTSLLFPYNTFITAVDYFQYVYPTKNAESVMTALSINVTLAVVFFNVLLVDRLGTHARITFAYVVFVAGLVSALLLTIFQSGCDSSGGFGVTLTAVCLVAAACGGQFLIPEDNCVMGKTHPGQGL